MDIKGKIKKVFRKTDNLREHVEDVIGKNLEALAKNKTLAKAEKALIKLGVQAGLTYILSQTGTSVTLTNTQLESISLAIVAKHNELRLLMAKQLEK